MDALRGFALLGILVVNIAFMASGYRMSGLPEPGFDSGLDWGVRHPAARRPTKIVAAHLHELSLIVVLRVLFQAPAVLAACLVGLALGKRAAALVDKVSPPLEVLVALALFAAQAAFSRLWLRGHTTAPSSGS
ncbi:hypothetical protein GCM10010404_05210 [Nonomuraea africana]